MRLAIIVAIFHAVLLGALLWAGVSPASSALITLVVLAFANGTPIFACLTMLAVLGAWASDRPFMDDFGNQVADVFKIGTGEEAQVMSTIPLFILVGYLMSEAKAADRMVRFAQALLGWLPGGLAVVTIFVCALFTTFTGASGVTIVALGGLVLPALLKQNYPERFSLGLIGGTGSVGLLFPPALPLFVYGTVYGFVYQFVTKTAQEEGVRIETWDTTRRFIFAGIVPGLVLCGILCLYAVTVAVFRKVPRQKFRLGELGRAFVHGFPELIMPLLVIGMIAKGLQIPEVASVTVLYVLFLEMVVYRDIKPKQLWMIVHDSMALVGAIFILIFAANALTNYFITADIPGWLVRWLTDTIGLEDANGDGRADQWWVFLICLNLLLLFVGMVMDIFSAILVVVPLIAFPAYKYGIDPYHLGVIFLLNLEVGYVHPPMGLNLFITSFKFRKPVLEVTIAVLPVLGLMLVALTLVTFVPSLTVVPPERNGTISELHAMVQSGWEATQSAKEIPMPDGTKRMLADCDAKVDQAREECIGAFYDYQQCSRKPAAEQEACRQAVVQGISEKESLDNLDLDDLLKEPGGEPGPADAGAAAGPPEDAPPAPPPAAGAAPAPPAVP